MAITDFTVGGTELEYTEVPQGKDATPSTLYSAAGFWTTEIYADPNFKFALTVCNSFWPWN